MGGTGVRSHVTVANSKAEGVKIEQATTGKPAEGRGKRCDCGEPMRAGHQPDILSSFHRMQSVRTGMFLARGLRVSTSSDEEAQNGFVWGCRL